MHELAKKSVGTSRAIVRKIIKAAPAAVIQQMPDLAQLHRDIRRWKQDSGRSRQNPQSMSEIDFDPNFWVTAKGDRFVYYQSPLFF